jgi:hypothetical protein
MTTRITVIALLSSLTLAGAGIALAQSGPHTGVTGAKYHDMHGQMHQGMRA